MNEDISLNENYILLVLNNFLALHACLMFLQEHQACMLRKKMQNKKVEGEEGCIILL